MEKDDLRIIEAAGNRTESAGPHLHLLGGRNMYPEALSLAKVGLNDEETQAVMGCDTPEQKYRLLRKYRCAQLEALHKRQQALDTLDYIICKIQGQKEASKG